MKNTIDDVNSTSAMPELKINELEGTAIETVQNEVQKEIVLTKMNKTLATDVTTSNRLIHMSLPVEHKCSNSKKTTT